LQARKAGGRRVPARCQLASCRFPKPLRNAQRTFIQAALFPLPVALKPPPARERGRTRGLYSMANTLLMPKATAVWLVDNTALSFEQIAQFCGLHPLEVKAIADGESAQGI